MGKMTGRFRVVDIMGYYHVQKEISRLFGGTRWKDAELGWYPNQSLVFKDKKEAFQSMHDNSAEYIKRMKLRERGPVVVEDK